MVQAQEEDFEIHDENLRTKARSLTFLCYDAMTGNANAADAWFQYKSKQKYNSRGQITEFKMYGRILPWPKYSESYTYDKKGQLIEIESDDESPTTSKIEYDSQGNRITIKTYGRWNKLTSFSRQAFKNKMRIEEAIYDTKTKKPLRRLYTYDAKGNMILFRIIDRNGKLIVITTLSYDKKGKISNSTQRNLEDKITTINSYTYLYFPNGSLKEKTDYMDKYPVSKSVYDKMGRILRETIYSGDAPEDVMSDEKYVYDKTDARGNWTQRSRYNNGFRTRLEIREIEY
jgi:hypothetical protein